MKCPTCGFENRVLIKNRKATKPCWTLHFCPYGQLVEYYPLTEKRTELSCEIFGHNCPVFYEDLREDKHVSEEIKKTFVDGCFNVCEEAPQKFQEEAEKEKVKEIIDYLENLENKNEYINKLIENLKHAVNKSDNTKS